VIKADLGLPLFCYFEAEQPDEAFLNKVSTLRTQVFGKKADTHVPTVRAKAPTKNRGSLPEITKEALHAIASRCKINSRLSTG
jgi:hypothetical protein